MSAAVLYWTVIAALVGAVSVRQVGWRVTGWIAGLLLIGAALAWLMGDADGLARW